MTERLVIIGGDAAGMSAAAQARRRRGVDQLEIVAFERGDYTSYAACGLPYLISQVVPDVNDLIARSPDDHRASEIDVRLRHEVVAIDTTACTVTVRDLGAGRDIVEPYDQLVIATGASPVRPALPGVDATGVHGIQTIGDGIALRAHLEEHLHADQHTAVVGAGYIGLELAEAMCDRGLPVTVVEGASQPMSTLDPDMGAILGDAMRASSIDLRTDTMVDGFEVDDGGHVRGVVTASGTIPADIVVLGIGVRPNVALARDAGIEIGTTGAIATDARMATSAPGVWAAGDCVESMHRVTGKPAFIALGTHANKQGRVAGVNATGGDATFPGFVGTAVTRVCDYEVGRTGLNEREAVAAGFDHVAAKIESTTRARYYPGAQPITVKVVAERGTARLLGAQIIGHEDAAKRIDVFATAIWAGMTADEFAHLDLGYAPPFAPVYDPVLVAARKAAHAATS